MMSEILLTYNVQIQVINYEFLRELMAKRTLYEHFSIHFVHTFLCMYSKHLALLLLRLKHEKVITNIAIINLFNYDCV